MECKKLQLHKALFSFVQESTFVGTFHRFSVTKIYKASDVVIVFSTFLMIAFGHVGLSKELVHWEFPSRVPSINSNDLCWYFLSVSLTNDLLLLRVPSRIES